MTKDQALFVAEALEEVKNLPLNGLAKSFYKKYGPSFYCAGPTGISGQFSDNDGKNILNTAQNILDAPE